jgi:hypothetical protein
VGVSGDTLECTLRDPDHAAVIADLEPELEPCPLTVPAGVFGK